MSWYNQQAARKEKALTYNPGIKTLEAMLEASRKTDDKKTDYKVRANTMHFEVGEEKVGYKMEKRLLLAGTEKPLFYFPDANDRAMQDYPAQNFSLKVDDNARGHLCDKGGPYHYGSGSAKGLPWDYIKNLTHESQVVVMNDMLQKASYNKWLVRGYEDTVRAVLSHDYPSIFNSDILSMAGGALVDHEVKIGSYRLEDSWIDEGNVVIRMTWDDGEAGGFRRGAVIRNSEDGNGALEFLPLIQRTKCSNSIVIGFDSEDQKIGFKIIHYKGANVEAMRAQFAMATQPIFGTGGDWINKMIVAQATALPDFHRVMQGLAIEHGWKENVLMVDKLNEGTEGDTTHGAVVNALTYAAQHNTTTSEQRYSMEKLGGQYLNATEKTWLRLAEMGRTGKKVKA